MEPSPTVEFRLLEEVASINRKLAELELEKRSIERVIVRMRREGLSSREVTRKNSSSRLLVEHAVLEALRKAKGKSVAVADLRFAVETVEMRLNISTFRSHLRRMKERGLIAQADYGRWVLMEQWDAAT
jgi:DNA-binding transcriptional ArsR family regulator